MSTRTWSRTHRRGEVLRAVEDAANSRRDGVLPTEVPGVAETFGDELALVAALQLRWHTRLAGRVEAALNDHPAEPQDAVVVAWRATAQDMPGVRLVLDTCTGHPSSAEMEHALTTARCKDWTLLAAMAGLAAPDDPAALRAGRALEERARASYDPRTAPVTGADVPATGRHKLLRDQVRGRLTRFKAHLAA